MATTALGFNDIVIAAPENSPLTVEALTAGINAAAASRGIEISPEGSDALDASRDVILADAVAAAGGGEWDIIDDDLCVTVPGMKLDTFFP